MRGIIFIAVIVYFSSCINNTGTHHIDAVNKPKKILLVSERDSIITKISQIASDVEYIPLQNSGRKQIKAIDKIITRGNKIYINLITDLFCFDSQGRFLYNLFGTENVTVKVFNPIYDFDIDSEDTSLVILSGNKILQFKNTETGFVYRKTMNLENLLPSKLDFVPGTNNILLSSIRLQGGELKATVLFNLNKDIIAYKRNYYNRFDPRECRIKDSNIHYQSDNKLQFKERFNDTVFSINSESNRFVPYLILDSHLSSTNSRNINDQEYYKILPFVVSILEVPRYIYFDYNFLGQSHQIFYDKYHDIRHKVDTWNGFLKDNIVGGPDFFPEYCSGGKLYSWIGVSDLKKYIKSQDFNTAQVHYPKKQEYLKKLVLTLKESDNPVLILVKPRD